MRKAVIYYRYLYVVRHRRLRVPLCNREIGFGSVAVRCEAVCARGEERFCWLVFPVSLGHDRDGPHGMERDGTGWNGTRGPARVDAGTRPRGRGHAGGWSRTHGRVVTDTRAGPARADAGSRSTSLSAEGWSYR